LSLSASVSSSVPSKSKRRVALIDGVIILAM
jgi:hypothetical protein